MSDLNVHLSTWCHLVRPDVTQCHVRQVADVDSQSLQQPRNDDRLNSTQFICFGPQRSISIETVDKQKYAVKLTWHFPGTLTLSPERQSARMSKITDDGLTGSGTGCFCFIALPIWQQWPSKG